VLYSSAFSGEIQIIPKSGDELFPPSKFLSELVQLNEVAWHIGCETLDVGNIDPLTFDFYKGCYTWGRNRKNTCNWKLKDGTIQPYSIPKKTKTIRRFEAEIKTLGTSVLVLGLHYEKIIPEEKGEDVENKEKLRLWLNTKVNRIDEKEELELKVGDCIGIEFDDITGNVVYFLNEQCLFKGILDDKRPGKIWSILTSKKTDWKFKIPKKKLRSVFLDDEESIFMRSKTLTDKWPDQPCVTFDQFLEMQSKSNRRVDLELVRRWTKMTKGSKKEPSDTECNKLADEGLKQLDKFIPGYRIGETEGNRYIKLVFFRSRLAVLVKYNSLFDKLYKRLEFQFQGSYPNDRKESAEWSLENRVRSTRYVLMGKSRTEELNRVLDKTKSNGSGNLNVDRLKAAELAARNEVDWDFDQGSLYGQMYKDLIKRPIDHWRAAPHKRMFTAYFNNERATDAGGPYRDVFESVCIEIEGENLPLCEPTANARTQMGKNRECFILKALSTNETYRENQLKMLSFLGRLFGLAIRTLHCLNLSLAPCVWKLLLGDLLTIEDVMGVDVELGKVLKSISDSDDPAELGLEPLNIDGEYVRPNKKNKHKIIDHFTTLWNAQCDAIRRGLACVVPLGKLALFTPPDLERLVCGEKIVDLELLRAHTNLEDNFSFDEDAIKWFFKMLEEIDEDDVRAMLRFVWGRSKLPRAEDTWEQSFKIQGYRRGQDQNVIDGSLPKAHTCFFKLDLPRYSSYEILKDRCLLAFRTSGSIDDD